MRLNQPDSPDEPPAEPAEPGQPSSIAVCHAIGGAESSPYVAQWLPSDGGPGASYVGEQLRLPVDAGTQQLAFAHLADGLGLFAHQGVWQRPGLIQGWIELPEPYLEIRLPLAGLTEVRGASGTTILETPRQAALNIENPGDPCEHRTPTGELNSRLATLVTASYLQGLFGADPLGERLDFLGRSDHWPTINAMIPMTATLRRISIEMLQHRIPQELTRLFLSAKAVELLSYALTGYLHQGASVPRQMEHACPRVRRQAERAHDILMANLGRPPLVHELAKSVGLTQRKLNAAFRERYGGTVLQCLMRWRLEFAQSLLRSGNHSLKEVAFELGYDHSHNFVSAFQRHLGFTPGEYRALFQARLGQFAEPA